MKYRLTIIISLVLLAGMIMRAEESRSANPVIWADVPDPDVIRVGEEFYMVSTTMHLMPGCPVMKSRDLVNWETIGYVFDRLDDHQGYNLEGRTVYGKGQWATSLRYHDGKFYVLFSPNDIPYKSYIYSAEDPAGKWTLVSRTQHFHDASLMFDDDGRVYVFSGGGKVHLRELEADLSGVKEGGVDMDVIFPDATETGIHEGSRVIKHNGKYYAFVISWPVPNPRRQLCYRADSITGPYEKHVVLESEFGGFPYVGQGCLVDGPDGDWWGMIFQDRGGVGRVLTLNPCRWVDGWPMLGDENGKVPAVVTKKMDSCSTMGVVTGDEFDGEDLLPVWQWNHNPVNEAWSLTDRKGYLRLSTSRVVDNIFVAPNTISQRMEGPECEAEVKIDISAMRHGDVAGFAAFNGDSGLLSVHRAEDGTWLKAIETSVALNENKAVTGTTDTERGRVDLGDTEVIYLKIHADFNPGRDVATFYYSLDGDNWSPLGNEFKMIYDYRRFFMGTRFAIYNYATASTGGYIDVDYFRYKKI